ncbi:molybdenum cofactor synthesis domain-containing protein [Anderseniella sp. Alg231-50]|uniref:molybdenum cofactor synthesis domain-containing protein n=1 Tax=Anderseniella sp. Alg231-50 TaxID=1922226 RepID=UPI000D55D5DF
MSRKLLDDCFLHDKDRMRHDDAVALILERMSRVAGVETIPLSQAHGRVLAEQYAAPRDIPAFNNAAVDGYAFAGKALKPDGDTQFKVVIRVAAGHTPQRALRKGEAARIFTGAVMPKGADTCMMQEDASVDGTKLVVPKGLKPGANTRLAGEDVSQGEVMLPCGERLRPQDVAAIASGGAGSVRVFNRLKVGLISTGDEIVRPGILLGDGQVYDSNHHLLRGLLSTVGAEPVDYGVIPDDRVRVERVVRSAAHECDVILTTGGASRGEADFIVETIQSMGALHAWQLAVKPGRPLAMGQIADTVFFGLPGNPVAAFVTFLLYAQPMLARLQGAAWHMPQRYPLPAGFSIAKKKTDRREFWRGWVDNTDEGPVLQKFQRDGSGLISGLRQATGLIEVPEETSSVNHGDLLGFIPFSEFGIS